MKKYNIFIVTGETSGDLHASHLVRALPKHYHITAVGGVHLKNEKIPIIFDLTPYAVTGMTEILRHVWTLRSAFQRIKQYLMENKPDLLILVDYPGFNLRLAQFAKTQCQIRILYYISPQIWAWKAHRIHIIKQYVDHMAVILPFEKPIYTQANIPCSYVGHPLIQTLIPLPLQQARQHLHLPLNQPVLALLPGSRKNEVKRLLPILVKTIKQLQRLFPDLVYILPIAPHLSLTFIRAFIQDTPIHLIEGQAAVAISAADVVVVASGTASLEAAFLKKPTCIIYKSSLISYFLAMKWLKVKFLGLANLIANKMVIPELLQDDCTPQHLVQIVTRFLNDPIYCQQHLIPLQAIHDHLRSTPIDLPLPTLVQHMVEINEEKMNVQH